MEPSEKPRTQWLELVSRNAAVWPLTFLPQRGRAARFCQCGHECIMETLPVRESHLRGQSGDAEQKPFLAGLSEGNKTKTRGQKKMSDVKDDSDCEGQKYNPS
ncbi:hypothetical protein RRG08_014053 [Elysia crispata]|uniref:Uncharacterized protein n=1 Tax=Elysia crispata TaxID=231223 RepID=A0AAE1DPK6_9GAST|nr:hypothetical protein RRG08_014053 [Elysia crispata]